MTNGLARKLRFLLSSLPALALWLTPHPATSAETNQPIRALLVIGGCCHDYRQQKRILTEGISARANVEWTIVHEGDGSTTHRMSVYEDPDWAKNYDVVVHDECCADVKDKAFVEGILKPHRDGLPAVNLHCAIHCYRVSFDDFKDWFEFTGIDSRAHGAQEPIVLNFVDPNRPIIKGMTNWTTIQEELYNNIKVYDTVTPLAYGQQGKTKTVVAWVNNYHGTRVFSTTLGHNNETVGDARYLDLVTRGLLWSVNKLNPEYLKPAKRVLAPSSAQAKKIRVPINLAAGKPASASGSQAGHEPGHAADGDLDTRWCAPDNGDGYWWQVDLQKPEEITGCRIVWESEDKPFQYKIAGSSDGTAWRTLAEATGSEPRPQNDQHKFAASGIRYVRVTVTKAVPGAWASFFECEVLGKQVVEKTVSLSRDPRLAGVKVPPGFEATIFAAPPDISYPTCIAAVPTGEVFVGVDQNGSLDAKPDRGFVVRCQDTDGDGVADKFNVFAKMDSPRGIVFDHNTLYVMHPPVLEAYYDDNGDGVADRSEVLVRGLAHDLKFRGADHTCNGVRLGIDGWLYIALGDYGALHAVAKDGSELQLHAGGIVRVRPDGSDLEMVVQGTRNIYDVAIDPLMNIFTCDNTNDGDDWNLRLSQMIPTGSYGYPSLFRHFSDESMPTMVDYGGGSPTGAIFLDEPGFPRGLGHGLYTCQWGWNEVTGHPLTEHGASFTAEKKEPLVSLPRPTGIDADGEGNLYVASWKGATFTYVGPNVGYILRVTPTGNKPTPFPNLEKAKDADLLTYLASPSAVWRLHVQRELLRRGANTTATRGLEKLALSRESLAVRVAALFTLKQLAGVNAQEPLLRIAKDATMREFAVRALADRKNEAAKIPTKFFSNALADANPWVKLQAVIALNRLGRAEAAEAILPLTADKDVAVSHVAYRALVALHATDACFKALDQGKTDLIPGALRTLRNLHEAQAVDGLIQRLEMKDLAAVHAPMLGVLTRLYYREGDWDGSWWGTRPDTSGPYFKPVTWEQSEKILQALQSQIARADEASLRLLLADLQLQKLSVAGLSASLIKLADRNSKLRPAVLDLVALQTSVSPEAVRFLEQVTLDEKADTAVRVRAFDGLQRGADVGAATRSAMSVLTGLSERGDTSAFAKALRNAFVNDGRHAKNMAGFEQLATTAEPAEMELAFEVLLQLSSNTNSSRKVRTLAENAISDAWKTPGLVSLLHAIGESHAAAYADQVQAFAKDARPEVAKAAAETLQRLGQNAAAVQVVDRADNIGKLAYEEVVNLAASSLGDAKAGAVLFEKVGCVKCHTTTKSEPLKGPFLGDITARYSWSEIIHSILRPNAQIAQGFVTTTVETKDGTEFEGFIVRESGDELELRNLSGATVFPIKEIKTRVTRTTSIMPEGLVDALTPGELASMLAYLKSLKTP
ncbi:MAG: heme-binding protein [Pedosphaera sp.]|nr:heme-binding protein [Pedosphaera sp.]